MESSAFAWILEHVSSFKGVIPQKRAPFSEFFPEAQTRKLRSKQVNKNNILQCQTRGLCYTSLREHFLVDLLSYARSTTDCEHPVERLD